MIRTVNWSTKEPMTKYVGATLARRVNDNYRIMSDVWGFAEEAFVKDDDGKFRWIVVESWEYSRKDDEAAVVEVDATPEVLQEYWQYLYDMAFLDRKERHEAVAAQIVEGARVRVVKGRKDKGAEGTVIKFINREYNMGYKTESRPMVGIATSDRKGMKEGKYGKMYESFLDVVWAWVHNVERVDVADVDLAQIEEEAEAIADEKFRKVIVSK